MITIKDILECKKIESVEMKEVKGGASNWFSSRHSSTYPDTRDRVISYWNSLYPTLK
jgi:hypothetical protein